MSSRSSASCPRSRSPVPRGRKIADFEQLVAGARVSEESHLEDTLELFRNWSAEHPGDWRTNEDLLFARLGRWRFDKEFEDDETARAAERSAHKRGETAAESEAGIAEAKELRVCLRRVREEFRERAKQAAAAAIDDARARRVPRA